MDHQSPELTYIEIDAARAGVGSKLAELERRVVGTAENATDTVRDTVQYATDTVRKVCDATTEGVSNVLDVPKHIRNQPWTWFGGAVSSGFVLGFLGRTPPISSLMARAAAPASSTGPGLWSELFASCRRELLRLGETAVTAASAAAQENLRVQFSRMTMGAQNDGANGRHSYPA